MTVFPFFTAADSVSKAKNPLSRGDSGFRNLAQTSAHRLPRERQSQQSQQQVERAFHVREDV
jgi:hypothetical protein